MNAKSYAPAIAIGKGNGKFSHKNKIAETEKISQLYREGFTDSNAENRIEKDQLQQKLQSFESERSKYLTPNQRLPRNLSGKETIIFHTKIKSQKLKRQISYIDKDSLILMLKIP